MTQLTVDGTIYEILATQACNNDPNIAQVFTAKRPRGRRTYNIWVRHDGSHKVSKF